MAEREEPELRLRRRALCRLLYEPEDGRGPAPARDPRPRLRRHPRGAPVGLRGALRATPASPRSSSTTATSATPAASRASCSRSRASTRIGRRPSTFARTLDGHRSARGSRCGGLGFSGGHVVATAAEDSADRRRDLADAVRRRRGDAARRPASGTRAAHGRRRSGTGCARRPAASRIRCRPLAQPGETARDDASPTPTTATWACSSPARVPQRVLRAARRC